jgi:hypothetical protein
MTTYLSGIVTIQVEALAVSAAPEEITEFLADSGYLFQVETPSNRPRIYRPGARGFTYLNPADYLVKVDGDFEGSLTPQQIRVRYGLSA